MTDGIQAYPLFWPDGWKRKPEWQRDGGGVMLERAFTGFAALPPPPDDETHWSIVLGLPRDASRADIIQRYRQLAKQHHVDAGGDGDMMARINAARDQALRGTE